MGQPNIPTRETNQTMSTEGIDAPDTGPDPEAPTTPEPEAEAEKPSADEPDWKAEAEKFKALSRKHEQRAKQNASAAKELDELKVAQLTEQEKAVKEARDEGLTEGLKTGNERLIRAEVIAAASGKAADPADVYAILAATGALAGLEVGPDGKVDAAAITTAVDDLVKTKPHLAAVRSPSFGSRTQVEAPSTSADMDAWIRSGWGH